jgi:hypothetical protein
MARAVCCDRRRSLSAGGGRAFCRARPPHRRQPGTGHRRAAPGAPAKAAAAAPGGIETDAVDHLRDLRAAAGRFPVAADAGDRGRRRRPRERSAARRRCPTARRAAALHRAECQGPRATVPELHAGAADTAYKMAFDACRHRGFLDRLPARRDIVVCGCETHVRVLQTVFGLLRAGRQVFLARDAVGSRRAESKETAIARMGKNGAEVVTTEMVLFEWLGTSTKPSLRRPRSRSWTCVHPAGHGEWHGGPWLANKQLIVELVGEERPRPGDHMVSDGVRFAMDSPLEESRFEPLVPARNGESFRSRSVLLYGRSRQHPSWDGACSGSNAPGKSSSLLAPPWREPGWNSSLVRKGVRSRLFCRPKRWKCGGGVGYCGDGEDAVSKRC